MNKILIQKIQSVNSTPRDPSAVQDILLCEESLAHYFGKKHAILVSSGTAAIHTALVACGIEPGDEVLVPALAPVMTVAPISYIKASPVFIDCKPNSCDLDETQLLRAVTRRTKVLIVVHLWGYPCNMDVLCSFAEKHKLIILEDACQAHGSEWCGRLVGTDGGVSCFSTRDGKLLSTCEGGFVLTDRDDWADECRRYRTHYVDIKEPSRSFNKIGANYRPTTIQALLTMDQLDTFSRRLALRRECHKEMMRRLLNYSGIEPVLLSDGANVNGYSAVCLCSEIFPPRQIAERLAKEGVINSVGSFGLRPLPHWPAVRKLGDAVGHKIDVHNCESLLNRALAIVLKDDMSTTEIDKCCNIIGSMIEK